MSGAAFGRKRVGGKMAARRTAFLAEERARSDISQPPASATPAYVRAKSLGTAYLYRETNERIRGRAMGLVFA